MNLWKLRLSMVATLAVIFGLSTLVFSIILTLAGVFDLVTIAILVVAFNLVQWLFSPYLVDAIYRVKEIKQSENPLLHKIVNDLSKKSGIHTPKIMLSKLSLPNAFAYGSPISGNRIAVTEGLLKTLNEGEVAAVIGHELGHLKHRDVQVMMAVSFLPALFYYIGYSLLFSSMVGGQRRNENGNPLIGIAFMVFSQFLTLFTLHVSRLREYYADRHSVAVVDNGATKLSTGLAKIVYANGRAGKTRRSQETQNLNAFKALFIADPDRAPADSAALQVYETSATGQKMVDEILAKKLTSGDRLAELLSTHPNIIKRLRALQELKENPNA
ncbi:MAG: zinc metalloprotease HtpX [Candidatus Bathyarchaeota archaeon]|nr:zinc metalloprotease HtpX [Candidatus Bathyarchaeota archaeon]